VATKPLRIREPSQLSTLAVRRLFSRRAPGRIAIEAAGTPADRVLAWEQRLARLQGACGCQQGGVGLLVGLAGSLLYLLLRTGGWDDPGSQELWIGVGVLCVTSTLGKVIGLRLAQRELRRAAMEVRAQWLAQGESRPTRQRPGPAFHARPNASSCCGNALTPSVRVR
jgi:hypothetical protein